MRQDAETCRSVWLLQSKEHQSTSLSAVVIHGNLMPLSSTCVEHTSTFKRTGNLTGHSTGVTIRNFSCRGGSSSGPNQLPNTEQKAGQTNGGGLPAAVGPAAGGRAAAGAASRNSAIPILQRLTYWTNWPLNVWLPYAPASATMRSNLFELP